MQEARAQAARLAEALRKAGACWRCGGKGEATFSGCHPIVIERPCKSCKGDGIRKEVRDALASTDALAWLREQKAEELERHVERINQTIRSVGIMTSNTGQYELVRNYLIQRIAELRRKEGEG